MPFATTFSPQSPACAPLQSHSREMATAPMIWSRRRCCARLPTSTPSSRAQTCRRGCSPSCATCFDPITASDVARSKTQPSQGAHLEFEEFRAALEKLPQDQREALILVGASGFSYEDAATICGCAVGTIKSRVNRARSKLGSLLYVESADDFGPDKTVRAVIGGNG